MKQLFQRIVVAIDGSPAASQAAALGIRLAKPFAAEVVFVHAIDYATAANEYGGGVLDAMTEHGEQILREAKEKAVRGEVAARGSILEGRAEYAVVRYAGEIRADAIVVGTRGAVADRYFVGSTAEGILRLAVVPVFVAHEAPISAESKFEKIVVAIDNSDPSDAAIKFATELASSEVSRLSFCHVVDDDTLYEEAADYGGATYPVLHEWLDEAAILSACAAQQAEGIGVRSVETCVLTGNPTNEVLNFAADEHADLIVVGAHGRRGLRHLVLGGVAHGLVRRSTIPVAVVRTRVTAPVKFAKKNGAVAPHVDTHGYVTLRSN